MSLKHLDYLMRPSTVALIGASERPFTAGEALTRNLVDAGFGGEIYLVNPNYTSFAGRKCYPNVASLPKGPDLAVIATPPATVIGLIEELGRRETKAAVVITAGFEERGGSEETALRSMVLEAAKPYQLRIVGPNCLGIMVPVVKLNASIAHIVHPIPGDIAFIAQSGAVQTSVLDWALSRGIGFSCVISLGDMADVDFGDMLDYLAFDFRTRAILLYMETVTHARKFMSAARTAARAKPVIVVKAGRCREGAVAATRHTGAWAGNDAIYGAAFRRAGMLRVYEVQDLFDSIETLAMMPRPIPGDRLAILTNGGGVGVIATDALIQSGGRLAELSSRSKERLDAVLPPCWSGGNPVDIIGDAPAQRYTESMEVLLDDKNVDAVLVVNCPIATISGEDVADAVVRPYQQRLKKPKAPVLLTSWLGEQAALDARRLFARHRIPTYRTPTDAVRAFMDMVRYQRNQQMLMETPPSIPESFSPDLETALQVIGDALTEDSRWLPEATANAILAAYGIPVVPSLRATTPKEAEALAAEFGKAVALQSLSPDISRKDDVCGIAIHLETPEAVRKAAEAMVENIGRTHPHARFRGFTVQPMARFTRSYELMIRMVDDAQFGPVIAFGHGGKYAEEIQDKALTLPPLNMHLAREVMSRTRICGLMEGKRAASPVDLDGIALTLVKISQLICDMSEIAELYINPLLADASGVVALGACIRLARSPVSASERLAIRPYPKELEDVVTLSDGRVLQIRPIRPEDEPGFLKIFDSLTPEERRMRFFCPIQELSHNQAARLTQIDYDREMALVLADFTDSVESGDSAEVGNRRGSHSRMQELYGSVRIIADPDNERAEYSIVVHRNMAGKGAGRLLMRHIISYARSRGIREIYGQVLRENIPMLKVCSALGFKTKPDPDDPRIVVVSLGL